MSCVFMPVIFSAPVSETRRRTKLVMGECAKWRYCTLHAWLERTSAGFVDCWVRFEPGLPLAAARSRCAGGGDSAEPASELRRPDTNDWRRSCRRWRDCTNCSDDHIHFSHSCNQRSKALLLFFSCKTRFNAFSIFFQRSNEFSLFLALETTFLTSIHSGQRSHPSLQRSRITVTKEVQ